MIDNLRFLSIEAKSDLALALKWQHVIDDLIDELMDKRLRLAEIHARATRKNRVVSKSSSHLTVDLDVIAEASAVDARYRPLRRRGPYKKRIELVK